MPEKTQAEIPYSLVEYRSEFKRPILEAWMPATKLVTVVLEVLKPSGYKLDGVEVNFQARKLDEYSIVFRRTTPMVPARNLTLGIGRASIVAENLDWTEAEDFISGHGAALDKIREVTGAEIESQKLSVGLHIQLKDRPRKDVTAHLAEPATAELLDGTPDFSGVIMMHEKTMIVVDASLAYANGLFVRIVRSHLPQVSFAEQANILRKDEQRVFDVLGLDGVL